jgi:hypothetical protein
MRNSQNHDLSAVAEIFEDFAIEIPKYFSERLEPAPEIMKSPRQCA